MWIRLKNIQVYAYHGALEHEREHGARFEVDVELEAALDNAVKSDDLSDTIDYVKVQQMVVAISTLNKFHLIETLADMLASELLTHFPAHEVVIRVRKPNAPTGGVIDTVEVEVRKRKD